MAGVEGAPQGIDQQVVTPDVNPVLETPPNPERPRLKLIKVITISGPSFSGKDNVVDILKKRHGWEDYDGEEDGFQRRGTNSGEPIDRARQEHIDFDKKQAQRFADLRPGDEMWIHQTRLGGIILAAEIDRRNEELGKQEWDSQFGNLPTDRIDQIPAVSILLWTSKRVRLKRAVNHARDLAKAKSEPIPKKEQVVHEMRLKELDDTKSWRKRYGTISIGDNPYSRRLQRKNGRPVYKRSIITDNLTLEQVADRVEEMALQLGAAEIINPSITQDISGVGTEGSTIFSASPMDLETTTKSNGEPTAPTSVNSSGTLLTPAG